MAGTLAAVTFMGSALLGITPAAAATCWGPSCTGINPDGTSCVNDARRIASTDTAWGQVQMIYSPSCGAVWGRLVGDLARVVISVWIPGQPSQGVVDGWDTIWWTRMIDGRPGIEDCYGAHVWPNGWQFMGCVT